jgi:hypothetical protein
MAETAQPRARKPPKGYTFTDEGYRWHWRPTPHYHVNESDYGDPLERCFTDEGAAKRALWRLFQRDYDYHDIVEYTHRPQDGTIKIQYREDRNASPSELTLGLLYCAEPDDCYMVEAE